MLVLAVDWGAQIGALMCGPAKVKACSGAEEHERRLSNHGK